MKQLLTILFMAISLFSSEIKEQITIKVAGPFASVSHPIILMQKNQALKDMGINIEFVLWKNPDELRALILNGDINFIALPTNVAANLYNIVSSILWAIPFIIYMKIFFPYLLNKRADGIPG